MKLLRISLIVILTVIIGYQTIVIYRNHAKVKKNNSDVVQYNLRREVLEDSIAFTQMELLELKEFVRLSGERVGKLEKEYLKSRKLEEINDSSLQTKVFMTTSLKPSYQQFVEQFLAKNRDTEMDRLCSFVKLSFEEVVDAQVTNVVLYYLEPWLLDGLNTSYLICKPIGDKTVLLTSQGFEMVTMACSRAVNPLLKIYFERDYYLKLQFQNKGYFNLEPRASDGSVPQKIYATATFDNKTGERIRASFNN